MKVYRYMSMKEFTLMGLGLDIVGNKCQAAGTDSEGICFLGEKTYFETEHDDKCVFSPEECIQFLQGIVTNDVLVEFETQEELRKSWGIYADPVNEWDYDATIRIDEYCIPSYNRDTFKPLRYAMVSHYFGTVWYPYY